MNLPVADLKPYRILIAAFVEGRLVADEFEVLYLFLFKNDRNSLSEPVYDVLNNLFSDVDAYCSDEGIRAESDLDAAQLHEKASIALQRLRTLWRNDGTYS